MAIVISPVENSTKLSGININPIPSAANAIPSIMAAGTNRLAAANSSGADNIKPSANSGMVIATMAIVPAKPCININPTPRIINDAPNKAAATPKEDAAANIRGEEKIKDNANNGKTKETRAIVSAVPAINRNPRPKSTNPTPSIAAAIPKVEAARNIAGAVNNNAKANKGSVLVISIIVGADPAISIKPTPRIPNPIPNKAAAGANANAAA